jgi:uncharacterized protein
MPDSLSIPGRFYDTPLAKMSQLVLDFSLAFIVASYGTLVGAGGGFLLVPIFLLVRDFSHPVAAGTSLAIVTANALSATLGFYREGKIDFRAGIVFALFTVPGAVFGALVTGEIAGPAFRSIFGGMLVLVALFLIVRGGRKEGVPFRNRVGFGWVHRPGYSYYEPVGAIFSLFVGMISSIFGIGGGVIHVPFMAEVLRFPVKVAVATSQFILVFTALAGFLTHQSKGNVNWSVAGPMILGAIVGAQAGIWLSKRIGGPFIVRLLSLALLGIGFRLALG